MVEHQTTLVKNLLVDNLITTKILDEKKNVNLPRCRLKTGQWSFAFNFFYLASC